MNPTLKPIFSDILDTFVKPVPFQDDSTKFYDRTDPGKSMPSECVHDWHLSLRDGVTRCHWCGASREEE
jgi:hypothetical protein